MELRQIALNLSASTRPPPQAQVFHSLYLGFHLDLKTPSLSFHAPPPQAAADEDQPPPTNTRFCSPLPQSGDEDPPPCLRLFPFAAR